MTIEVILIFVFFQLEMQKLHLFNWGIIIIFIDNRFMLQVCKQL